MKKLIILVTAAMALQFVASCKDATKTADTEPTSEIVTGDSLSTDSTAVANESIDE